MNCSKLVVAIVAGASVLVGCSHQKGEAPPEFTVLQEVNDLLRAAAGTSGRAPAKAADLNAHQTMFPRGFAAVKSGDVVVLWGTPLKGEGEGGKDEVVVAYEKDVPTNGGHVLLSAGTVKKMSASEFQSAPKAK